MSNNNNTTTANNPYTSIPSSTRRQQQRPTVQNGRLIYNQQQRTKFSFSSTNFSWYRFSIIVGICTIVWYSNPMNIPNFIKNNTKYRPMIYDRFLRKKFRYRSTTNYGFFTIMEGYSELSMVAFGGYTIGKPLRCTYGQSTLASRLCDQLRTTFCHERPLLLPTLNKKEKQMTKSSSYTKLIASNLPYIIHRFICWSSVVLAMIYSCFIIKQPFISESSVVIDAIGTLFINPMAPLSSAIMNIIYSTIFIYPTLEKMYSIIQIQHPTSYFTIFTSSMNDNTTTTDMYNYITSVLSILAIAITLNGLSKIWSNTNTCSLQFLALVAVCIGYYRGCCEEYDIMSPNNIISSKSPSNLWNVHTNSNTDNNDLLDEIFYRSSSYLYPYGPTVLAITWYLIIHVYQSTSSLVSVILWITGNIVGYSIGKYQYENIYVLVTIQNTVEAIASTIQNVVTSIENFFFG